MKTSKRSPTGKHVLDELDRLGKNTPVDIHHFVKLLGVEDTVVASALGRLRRKGLVDTLEGDEDSGGRLYYYRTDKAVAPREPKKSPLWPPQTQPSQNGGWKGQLKSIDDLIDYSEGLAKEVLRLRQENRDLKNCIDRWGARVSKAKIIPLNFNNVMGD
jgi:DNA-binding transcriptional ArsR family regulator